MATTLRPVVAHQTDSLPTLVENAVLALRQLGDALEQYRRELAVPVAAVAPIPDDRPLRTDEAAAALNVSYRTLMRLIALGEIGAVRPGKAYLVPRQEIDRYLSGARRTA